MLLQTGIPGGIEFVIFNLAVALLVGFLTYRDASNRPGTNAALWALVMGAASLLLSLVGFLIVFVVYYLVVLRE